VEYANKKFVDITNSFINIPITGPYGTLNSASGGDSVFIRVIKTSYINIL